MEKLKTELRHLIKDSVIGDGIDNFSVIPHIISGQRESNIYQLNLRNNNGFTISCGTETEAKKFGKVLVEQIEKFYQKSNDKNNE